MPHPHPRPTLSLMAAHLPVFQDAGLLSVIADPIHTPVTLFWPTDQALQALPAEQQDFLFKQDNKEKLKKYLKFHVIRDAKVFCFVHMWLQRRPRETQPRSSRSVGVSPPPQRPEHPVPPCPPLTGPH